MMLYLSNSAERVAVTVESTGGFTGTVTFSCTVSPAPSLAPVCSLNPAEVHVTSGAQATSTLTVAVENGLSGSGG